MKMTIIKTKYEIKPCNNYDMKMLELLKDGVYQCELKKARSVKHNSKYWLLCQAMSFHFNGTSEKWHRFFKNTFLGYDELKLPNGKIHKLESSTAFENLDQNAFNEYYKKIEEWLLQSQLSIDEIIGSL